ncbi:MAG: RNA methyltransferase [Bacteroidota bacterium]|nr:RNA methyltransferase [Bacteroidota bacterium]
MNRVIWKSATLREKQKLYSQLLNELSLNKRQLFDTKIKTRTRHFSLAIEDMMKTQNASALLRTADAFGIQRIDIYDKNERFNVSTGISKGVEKWLDSNFFNSYNDGGIAEWVSRLKATGRKLYVTALDKNAVPLSQIDPTVSATICFGNEQEGASSEILSLADKTIYIPMKGFVESFNVSVSCGIVLHHLTLGMEEAGIPWGLDEEDALNTKINWALRTIPNPQRFL